MQTLIKIRTLFGHINTLLISCIGLTADMVFCTRQTKGDNPHRSWIDICRVHYFKTTLMNILEKIGYNITQFTIHTLSFGLIGKDPFEQKREGLLFDRVDRYLIIHDERSMPYGSYVRIKLVRDLRREIHGVVHKALKPLIRWVDRMDKRLKNRPQ